MQHLSKTFFHNLTSVYAYGNGKTMFLLQASALGFHISPP